MFEFNGTVKFMLELVDNKIVLPTSSKPKEKLDDFVITVFIFAILGSTSKASVSAFHKSPVPASAGYSPVEFAIASSTYCSVARRDVSTIP